jgi:hypothetical protein
MVFPYDSVSWCKENGELAKSCVNVPVGNGDNVHVFMVYGGLATVFLFLLYGMTILLIESSLFKENFPVALIILS